MPKNGVEMGGEVATFTLFGHGRARPVPRLLRPPAPRHRLRSVSDTTHFHLKVGFFPPSVARFLQDPRFQLRSASVFPFHGDYIHFFLFLCVRGDLVDETMLWMLVFLSVG